MLNLFNLIIFFNDDEIINYLKEKGYRVSRIDKNKINNATTRARDTYSKKVEEKLNKALEQIIMEGKRINPTLLSRVSNTNWRTAKKFLNKPETQEKINQINDKILFREK